MFVFGWYAFRDITVGESAEIVAVKPFMGYVLEKLKEVLGGKVDAEVIRSYRKCFFEHPGAFLGHF